MNGQNKQLPFLQKILTSDAMGGFIFAVIAGLLVWLIVYLVKRKLNNPDIGPEWGGIGLIAFFALLFVFFSGSIWFGLLIESKSIDIDANFLSVKSDTVITRSDGNRIYAWKLECQWNDPQTGRQITFTSEPFEGADLYYNRNKIKVSVYPDKPETFHTVDLSFITIRSGSGIKLISENLLSEADRDAKVKQERKQAYEKDQGLKREQGRGLTVLLNRIMLAGTALLIFAALIIGGWLYLRHSASQNKVQEFVQPTEIIMQEKGWSFSFQPYDQQPWEGVRRMLRKETNTPYPYGLAEINGTSNKTEWKLKVSINRELRRYYRSPQEYWLMTTDATRLTIPIASHAHQQDAFFILIEIPHFFPENIKIKLAESFTTVDKNYLADLPVDDDQALVHLYIQRLFDDFEKVLYKSNETHRSGEFNLRTRWLTITNNPKQADQILNQNVKDDLKKISKSEKGGYGILISNDAITISTLSATLNPNDIQTMVNLGIMLKAETEKM